MANMLVSYDLSCKYDGLTKDYTLKFKVAKGVKVSYSQVGNLNKIDLTEDGKLPGGDNNKTYKITGPLKVQFFQNQGNDAAKGVEGANEEGPIIEINP